MAKIVGTHAVCTVIITHVTDLMEDASLAVKIDFMVSSVKEVIVFSDIILNILILSQSLKHSIFPYERLAIAEQKQS